MSEERQKLKEQSPGTSMFANVSVLLIGMYLGILFANSFPLLAVLWFLWGLSEVYFPIIYTIPYELPRIKTSELAVATAFVGSMFTAGASIGPIMAGYVAQAFGSLQLGLGVTCVFPFLLVVAGLLIPETGPAARREEPASGQD